MEKHKLPSPVPPAGPPHRGSQHAHLALRFGERVSLTADVNVTSAGLLAIGGLVSAILLSTAVVVRSARRPD